MDVAIGARQTWVMPTIDGLRDRKKLVRECSYPLTAHGVVDRIYTGLGIIVPTRPGSTVVDLLAGVDLAAQQLFSEVPITSAEALTPARHASLRAPGRNN